MQLTDNCGSSLSFLDAVLLGSERGRVVRSSPATATVSCLQRHKFRRRGTETEAKAG